MKALELIKKYKIYILSFLLLVFFFKSCGKSKDISKLEKQNIKLEHTIDSLVSVKDSTIRVLHENHYNDIERIDTWIKEKNRGPQLMELHPIVDSLLKKAK